MRRPLYTHRDDIAEALDAGTSRRNLARTYGVALPTMQEFIGRWLPRQATEYERTLVPKHAARNAQRRDDPNYRLHECAADTLRHHRNRLLRHQRALEELL